MEKNQVIFISGGVRSGKSSYAETIAEKSAERLRRPLYYLATSPRDFGREMDQRIQMHQSRRDQRWQTLEEVFHISDTIAKLSEPSVILVDCLTLWTSTAIFAKDCDLTETLAEITKLLQAAENHLLILVSNDLNEEIPIADEYTQKYIYYLEAVHKLVIAHSKLAVQTIAGMPQFWKGEAACLKDLF
jgi:adenosylcobinamide kinase/adenosylcobinamide-phosphate guanylyltransferase